MARVCLRQEDMITKTTKHGTIEEEQQQRGSITKTISGKGLAHGLYIGMRVVLSGLLVNYNLSVGSFQEVCKKC